MTMEDMKSELGISISNDRLSKLLMSLEEKGLVGLYKGRKGGDKACKSDF